MIRIFLPLILALLAGFGPWNAEGVRGLDIADGTISCLAAMDFSFAGSCAPTGTLQEKLVTWTMVLGSAGAVLSILGLLPLVGRVTSVVVIGAGAVGLGAAGLALVQALQGAGLGSVAWGVYATLAAALLTAFVGLGGVRGEGESDY